MTAEIFISNDNVLELARLKNGIAAVTTGQAVLSVGSATTFTRTTGDFVTDGFAAGMEVQASGFANDVNKQPYTVASVAATTLTINEGCLKAETGDGCEKIDGFTFINNATITVTLKDRVGVAVAGETWPLAMNYLTGSNGIYRATLAFGLSLQDGKPFTAEIVADGGLGLRGGWSFPLKAKVRKS